MADFKSWFINSDDATEATPSKPVETKKPSEFKFPSLESEPKTESVKFPETSTPSFNPTFSSTPVGVSQPSQEHLTRALELYEKGFENLNQDGFDFFEYYSSIISGGDVNNPQIYAMAFQMARSMDKTITKEKLLQQAEYYISELNKIYQDYVSKGHAKRDEVINQKATENNWLVGELNSFKQQLETLQIQIQDRESKLLAIDSKFEPLIKEVESKISANETANNRILSSIQQVKNGVITNVK